MISSVWNTVIYDPLYNILILLIGVLPGESVGMAIILLTILVRLVLYPLTGKSIKAQHAMRELEPELKALREEYKNDKQKLAQKTMELYQKRGVSPFSGCLPLLIQIHVIFGLYFVFSKGLEQIDTTILYSFVHAPASLDLHFFMFDLAVKSVILAGLAGFTQYIQADLSLGRQGPIVKKEGEKPSFQEDFARSMQIQMRYILPVMISFIAWQLPAAVALYWTTSNILSIVQELLMKRKK